MAKISAYAIAFLLIIPSFSFTKEFKHDVIIFKREFKSRSKAGMKPVVFPHKLHAESMKCNSCHNKLFKPKLGANKITMKKIMEGKACGACHNGVKAWPAFHCDRCHRGK